MTYVVGDGGEPIARRKGPKPILVSPQFKARAASHPIQLARSLVACFASWATDWVQSDSVSVTLLDGVEADSSTQTQVRLHP